MFDLDGSAGPVVSVSHCVHDGFTHGGHRKVLDLQLLSTGEIEVFSVAGWQVVATRRGW
ncbi:hypothetical protein Ae331Ps2_1449 [Pseudonocardia sp. Ae331_Ps2]|nr:hypothetical protein Ae331Ps2_1449 [Pseudonocardia sp. Ae331_Ps2]